MLKHVLVVDDSKSARFMLSKLLEKHGLTADMVDSAEAALDYLDGKRPDAVFMDHMMPGMDGLEATRRITADPRFAGMPVVLFTSKEGDEYIAEARASGAQGVLPKPPSPDKVKAVVDELAALVAAQPERAPAAVAAPAPAAALDPAELERLVGRSVDAA
ncbi:MAG TPA: response regulator, partial [Gammaproteobacteria bacterium]